MNTNTHGTMYGVPDNGAEPRMLGGWRRGEVKTEQVAINRAFNSTAGPDGKIQVDPSDRAWAKAILLSLETAGWLVRELDERGIWTGNYLRAELDPDLSPKPRKHQVKQWVPDTSGYREVVDPVTGERTLKFVSRPGGVFVQSEIELPPSPMPVPDAPPTAFDVP